MASNNNSNHVEVIKSNKGHYKIIHKGFMYTKHKSFNNVTRWRCAARGSCRGSIMTSNDFTQPTPKMSHTHPADYKACEVAKARYLIPKVNNFVFKKEHFQSAAGLGVISTPFGALLSGILVDVLGRKSAIIVTSLPFLVGWVTTALASDVTLLYLGRAVSGLAAGMTTASYLYVAEVASKEHRSVLSAFGSIFVSLGVLIVYTLGFLTTWERTALVSSAFSVVTVVCMLNVPESPAWCVSKNHLDNAYKSLKWLRRDSKVAEVELYTLVKSKNENEETKEVEKPIKRFSLAKVKDFYSVAKSPAVFKPFFILLFFFIFQIGSGIYVFLFYATQIFQEFGTDYDENLITVTIGVFRFVMAIIGAFLMSKVGRRPLGMFSGISMSLSMLLVCIYEFVADSYPVSPSYQFLPFVSVLFHVGFSMTGFLQLPWILTSELFPLNCRGLLSGVVSSIAYFCIFIAVKIYSDLLRILRLEGLLWGFFIMSSVGTLFVYFFVPETKNKSLKEISRGFMKDKSSDVSDENFNKVTKDISNNNNHHHEIVLDVPKKSFRF